MRLNHRDTDFVGRLYQVIPSTPACFVFCIDIPPIWIYRAYLYFPVFNYYRFKVFTCITLFGVCLILLCPAYNIIMIKDNREQMFIIFVLHCNFYRNSFWGLHMIMMSCSHFDDDTVNVFLHTAVYIKA